MCVWIILYASHTCVKQEHHHSCIMMYASLDQHHDNCIAPPLQSYILWVHHYHGFEHLHLELEDFVVTPWWHWHTYAYFATSILQLCPIIKSWARMFQKSSPKPFFVYPHLFSQILCWISPTSVFFMWWSQHCENWPPCIIVVPRSFWRSLFGFENLTCLTYPIALKSRARIKFGCWLKGIIVFRRRP